MQKNSLFYIWLDPRCGFSILKIANNDAKENTKGSKSVMKGKKKDKIRVQTLLN
jgi:hypothetical protein